MTSPKSASSHGDPAGADAVWSWLSAAAGAYVDWRFYANSGSLGTDHGRVLVVVWDAGESPCPHCRQEDRRPCPVDLDRDDTPRTRTIRHDCGAELVPARHITRWLDEIRDQDAVRGLLTALEQYRPVQAAGGPLTA